MTEVEVEAPERHPYTLPGDQHDPRTAEEFRAALWRETDRSLRRKPGRWEWKRSDELESRITSHGPAQNGYTGPRARARDVVASCNPLA